MATTFDEIFDMAITKFADYGLAELTDSEKDDVLTSYLNSAQARFQRICRVDLTDRDEALRQYNQDLDMECKEILATGMAYFWVTNKTLDSEAFTVLMSTKDYSYTSMGEMLKQIRVIRAELKQEFHSMISHYSWYTGDIEQLQV